MRRPRPRLLNEQGVAVLVVVGVFLAVLAALFAGFAAAEWIRPLL